MSGTITWVLVALTVPVFALGLLEVAYYPLAIAFEARGRRPQVFSEPVPLVTVVVPAYNEGRVLANCVSSILADRYPRKEIVLVDDGSTDDTLAIMDRWASEKTVTIISQQNAGKAAALNAGIARARGEILLFVDADGVFTPDTVSELLTGFDHVRVGAVCGNDEPVNLDRPQTHLLALLTHGTAFARRALARIGCLTIVSGNLGAFRADVVREVGGFTEGFIGEDLELTWRVHRAGYRVGFRPRALVYAEVPSTVRALWRQRVRWTRGHLQTARMHHDMLGRPRFGKVAAYLPFNVVAMLVVPVLQLIALVLVATLLVSGSAPIDGGTLGLIGMLGLGSALMAVCFAVWLDRAWRDLRFLYVLPLWIVYSLMLSSVVVSAWWLELRGAPARWNSSARTGVVSRADVAGVDAD